MTAPAPLPSRRQPASDPDPLPFRPTDLVPGALVHLNEADYLYGIGDMRLRLSAAPDVNALWDRVEWVALNGVELRQDGYEKGQRRVMARTTAIKVLRLARPQEGTAT